MHITHDKSWVHLKDNLKVVGYEVEMLEYHDLKGQFHKAEYSEEGGRVERWDLILKTKDRKKDRNRKEDSTDWHFLWMQLHLLQSYKGWCLPNQSFRVNLNSQLALNVWTWCIFERLHLMKSFKNNRTPANDPRNRGENPHGFGWDPDWVNGTLMMASLVFDAVKPTSCPLQLSRQW